MARGIICGIWKRGAWLNPVMFASLRIFFLTLVSLLVHHLSPFLMRLSGLPLIRWFPRAQHLLRSQHLHHPSSPHVIDLIHLSTPLVCLRRRLSGVSRTQCMHPQIAVVPFSFLWLNRMRKLYIRHHHHLPLGGSSSSSYSVGPPSTTASLWTVEKCA